ncbi:type II secretion system protein [Poriferisphaera sp. WC338]|uniref:type II secretion system protein n=1 Tax=Poriferisphaera sp. WC338 TaxID=3425129 RepID=UPI003D816ED2
MRLRGFTLIELMVCMIIIGLLAGTVVVSLRGLSDKVTRDDVIDQLVMMDQRVRSYAVLHRKAGQLRFDLSKVPSTIRLVTPSENEYEAYKRDGQTWRMHQSYRLSEIRLAGGESSHTQIALPVSSQGIMTTYALKIDRVIERIEVDTSASVWLVFAGITGQVYQTEKQEEIDAILSAK